MNSKKTLLVLLLALTIAPGLAFAQGWAVEVTPSVGYRWGGEIDAEVTDLFLEDVELDPSESFGLTLDFPVTRHLQLELLYDHQATELEREGGLFTPDGDAVDVDVDYSHVGLLVQWPTHAVTPFVVTSLGVGRVAPDLPGAQAENRFSASLGGGIKLYASEHVGVRIEARHFYTDLGEGWDDDDHDWHRHCDDHDCSEGLLQGEVKVGVIIAF